MRSNEARRLKNANKRIFGMLGDYIAILLPKRRGKQKKNEYGYRYRRQGVGSAQP